jgi:glutamate-1-semialdehyde 2,1-aminomutase
MTIAQREPAVSTVEDVYRRRTPRSAELWAQACRSLPGGNSRQAAYWAPYPLTIDRARGARLTDADGNEYLDLLYNYTSMVHGYAYPPILDAVDLTRGTGWAANNVAMIDLAELIVERVASIERIRFTNSGTEAGLLALTIAREITGRHQVLMARGGYHGSLPEFESGTLGKPGPATLLADYGDLASFERELAERGRDVAAVFVEPVQGAGGIVRGTPEFLRGLSEAAHRAGALFVLDEVITFRLATGGLQAELGLDPDLTMLGKIIGGGFPVGAVGGKREHLDVFEPERMRALHSGTYNANPVTMAAGVVSVRELTAERIARMHGLAERLERGLLGAAERAGVPAKIRRVGSLLAIHVAGPSAPASPAATAAAAAPDPTPARFHLAALNHGLMFAPRGMMALATVLDEAAIDEAVERAGAAMADVAADRLG